METDRHLALGAHLDARKSWKKDSTLAEISIKDLPLGASQGSLEPAASCLGFAPPETGTLLVEVPALPCTPVSNL